MIVSNLVPVAYTTRWYKQSPACCFYDEMIISNFVLDPSSVQWRLQKRWASRSASLRYFRHNKSNRQPLKIGGAPRCLDDSVQAQDRSQLQQPLTSKPHAEFWNLCSMKRVKEPMSNGHELPTRSSPQHTLWTSFASREQQQTGTKYERSTNRTNKCAQWSLGEKLIARNFHHNSHLFWRGITFQKINCNY
jgi:hypothetical protein